MNNRVIRPACYAGATPNLRLPQNTRIASKPLQQSSEKAISEIPDTTVGIKMVLERDPLRVGSYASCSYRSEERGGLALSDKALEIAHAE